MFKINYIHKGGNISGKITIQNILANIDNPTIA